MKVILIAALGKNREIGKNNDLMWHLPKDMKFFKDTTVGSPVIMGRKNWDSIPERYRPLSGRLNIVLTHDTSWNADGAMVAHKLEDALHLAAHTGAETCYVVGGAQIYALALDAGVADELVLTHVEADFPDAEAFFPPFEAEHWKKEVLGHVPADDKHAFAFTFARYTKT